MTLEQLIKHAVKITVTTLPTVEEVAKNTRKILKEMYDETVLP